MRSEDYSLHGFSQRVEASLLNANARFPRSDDSSIPNIRQQRRVYHTSCHCPPLQLRRFTRQVGVVWFVSIWFLRSKRCRFGHGISLSFLADIARISYLLSQFSTLSWIYSCSLFRICWSKWCFWWANDCFLQKREKKFLVIALWIDFCSFWNKNFCQKSNFQKS